MISLLTRAVRWAMLRAQLEVPLFRTTRLAFAATVGLATLAPTRGALAQSSRHRHSSGSSSSPPSSSGSSAGPSDNGPGNASNEHANANAGATRAAPPEPVHHVEPTHESVSGQLGFSHPGRHSNEFEIEVMVFGAAAKWRWPWGGFVIGPGLRFGIPLFRNGPFSGINNDIRVNVGANFMLWPGSAFFWWINVPLALQYNVFFTSTFSMFLEAGASADFYPVDGANCYDHPVLSCDQFGISPVVGLGARLHSRTSSGYPALTVRFEYPTGLSVGGSF